WARRRCCRAAAPDTRLVSLIEAGEREFDSIEIEPEESPPVVRDNKHPEFFAAIIELDGTAMPDLEDLLAWRAYVIDNGALAKRPAAESAFPLRTRRQVMTHLRTVPYKPERGARSETMTGRTMRLGCSARPVSARAQSGGHPGRNDNTTAGAWFLCRWSPLTGLCRQSR